jgi:orotidine-5'-phosphate decarboxylase
MVFAQAIYKALNADGLTMSPFMGNNALESFLDDYEQGVTVLCKDYNPGANQLLSLTLKKMGN